MKTLNRFVFLNIGYGEKLKPFLETCAKIDPERKFSLEEIKKFEDYKGKFKVYGVSREFEGENMVKSFIYIGTWLLKIPEFFLKKKIIQLKKKGVEPKKMVSLGLKIIRKIKFSMFCSFLPDLAFFGTRILLYINLNALTTLIRALLLLIFLWFPLTFI